ncbi:sensor histidine kinase, partial [Actinospica robiniae]|uniref:sensor histidine kinase n=1 Tax=Actinospica robiniae TaxID=304901 RepID=UPI00040FA09A
MSRRIALVTLGLITALLVLAVVPLGLSLTANERASFRFGVESAARQLSAQAEEYLADHDPPTAMNQALAGAPADGDCGVVLRASGQVAGASACPPGLVARATTLAAEVRPDGGQVAFTQEGDWLLAAVPVGDDGNHAGTAVLARSADPVDDRIAVVWAWLAGTGLAVLVLGALLARWLARWVSRPLTVLSGTASRFGDGDLDARAPTLEGPGEVRELSTVFNRMAERTESLIGSHREWVADVSHQLRTPLTALRLRVDLLADEAEEETAVEMAGLQVEMARLASLVDGLLAVARAEGDVPRPEPVRADRVAAERVAAWEPVAADRGVSLEAATAAPAVAHIGPGDLDQILDNLIANALDSVPEGSHVRISVNSARSGVVVRVVDDGPGMPEEVRVHAFRRFGRSGTGGSGLGLAIVHRLASVNGGEVALEQTPGGGLTVRLDLPAAR